MPCGRHRGEEHNQAFHCLLLCPLLYVYAELTNVTIVSHSDMEVRWATECVDRPCMLAKHLHRYASTHVCVNE